MENSRSRKFTPTKHSVSETRPSQNTVFEKLQYQKHIVKVLGAVLGALGAVLGALGALGAVLGALGALGAVPPSILETPIAICASECQKHIVK